jgi:hypothetical protein
VIWRSDLRGYWTEHGRNQIVAARVLPVVSAGRTAVIAGKRKQ